MAESDMLDLLEKLRLHQFIPNILEEKITPDIVCKLSSYEFRLLGIAGSNDIMSLRVYCSKYRRFSSQSRTPKFNKPKYKRESLLEEGFIIKEISSITCVTERTI